MRSSPSIGCWPTASASTHSPRRPPSGPALRGASGAWQIRPVASLDWSRVTFTEHMTEAAAVVGECEVVLDFGSERATYVVKVYRSLKGAGEGFFAVGTSREDPEGFRPVGDAGTPEEALQACLNAAGVYLRRRVKQAGG